MDEGKKGGYVEQRVNEVATENSREKSEVCPSITPNYKTVILQNYDNLLDYKVPEHHNMNAHCQK
jgi:hypothetical protein